MTVIMHTEPVAVALGELMEIAQVCGQSSEPAVRTLGSFILVRCQLIVSGKVEPITLTHDEVTAVAQALADTKDEIVELSRPPRRVTH